MPGRSYTAPPEIRLEVSTVTGMVDAVDDCDLLATLLVRSVTALIDVCGADPTRPRVSAPSKVARRALTDILDELEEEKT